MAIEQSLVIIKPDGLIKSLTGNIITALSETKLKIVGAKIVRVSRELAAKHYEDMKKKELDNANIFVIKLAKLLQGIDTFYNN